VSKLAPPPTLYPSNTDPPGLVTPPIRCHPLGGPRPNRFKMTNGPLGSLPTRNPLNTKTHTRICKSFRVRGSIRFPKAKRKGSRCVDQELAIPAIPPSDFSIRIPQYGFLRFVTLPRGISPQYGSVRFVMLPRGIYPQYGFLRFVIRGVTTILCS